MLTYARRKVKLNILIVVLQILFYVFRNRADAAALKLRETVEMFFDFLRNYRLVFFLAVSLFSGGAALAGDELVLQCNGSVKHDQFTIDNGEVIYSVMGPINVKHEVLIRVFDNEGAARVKVLDKGSDGSFRDNYSYWYSDFNNNLQEELSGFSTGDCGLAYSTSCLNIVTVTEYAFRISHFDNDNERKYNTRNPKEERDSAPDLHNSFQLVLNRFDGSLTYHRVMQNLAYLYDPSNSSTIRGHEFNFTGTCVNTEKKF